MKTSLLIAVLLAASAAQTQNLKMIAVRFPANGATPNTIQFLCSQKYDRTECVKDATALRQAMVPYPLQLLGAWSFVLVPADDWKALVRSQGGDPVSPAFSMLDQRVTLLDESLFVGSASRSKALMQRFSLMGAPLVDLALTHEMGHGICQEKDERKADNYGKDLRDGEAPDCSKTAGRKMSSQTQSVVTATTNGNQSGSDIIKSQTATVKAPDNGDGASAESNTGVSELHTRAEVQDALRQIWSRAGGGLFKTESAFTYDKYAGVKLVPPTNQYETMTFEIQQTTQAIFHTHPAGQNRMSQNDINTANQNHVDMYVLSRDGLYFYRPGMKAPQLVMIGTDFLGKKGDAK